MSAALEIQKALYDALSANSELTVLLGGSRVFDDMPERIDPPYILFASVESLNWSSDGSAGEEHFFDLEIWSTRNGRKQVARIADEVKSSAEFLCAGLPSAMNEHHLVNLTVESVVTERFGRDGLFKGIVTLRAVSEAASD